MLRQILKAKLAAADDDSEPESPPLSDRSSPTALDEPNREVNVESETAVAGSTGQRLSVSSQSSVSSISSRNVAG